MCRAAGTVLSWASSLYIARQVVNLTLMSDATEHDDSESNGTSNDTSFVSQSSSDSFRPTPVGPQADLYAICIVANGGEEASSNGGPTLIARARRPSYSRLAAPPAVRSSSWPRTRRATHRVRVEATVSSSSVPSQRSNPLPMEA